MDSFPDSYSHFMFPGMYRPGSARSVPQHAYDPSYDQYFPGSFYRQTPRGHANYEDPYLYYRHPRHFQGYYEPHSLPYLRDSEPSSRRSPHWQFEPDPACIDLRILPAFALGSRSGQSARQQRPVGAFQPPQQGSPPRHVRSTPRQVPVEGISAADVLRSQFPFLVSRYQNSPSRGAPSHRSEAESVEDIEVEQPQDLASEQQRLQHLRRQQQEEEQLLRHNRTQEERENMLAQQLHERELQKERERRLEQHLHEQRLAEERERRLAYQHMQEQRLQQQLYQRRHEQELAEEELRLFEAAQRQHRLQQQRQEQQRQQQLAEALHQQQQELQRQEELIAAQQRQLLLQRQRREAQQAAAKQAAEEQQKMHQQQQQVHQQQEQTQSEQQKPETSERLEGTPAGQQQQTENGEKLEGRASVQQPGVDVGSIIQKLMRMQSMRAEHPMVQQLAKANAKLDELSQGLRDVRGCVLALKATRHSQPAKLKQRQGQLGSPEQLQKRLVELGERSMQVVLSMDELHSQNDKVRSLRKCIVKKALAFMEEIDNIKSSMLHSILVPQHAHDNQSELSQPVSEARSEASGTAEEEAEKSDTQDDTEDGAAADTAEPVSRAVKEAAEEDAWQSRIPDESGSGAPAVTKEPVGGRVSQASQAVEQDAEKTRLSLLTETESKHESENDEPAATAEPGRGAVTQTTATADQAGVERPGTKQQSDNGLPAATMESVGGAVSQASEVAEQDAEKTESKHEPEAGASAATAEPVNQASEAAEEGAKDTDTKDQSAPAVMVVGHGDDPTPGDNDGQQVADALATLKAAEEAQVSTAGQQQKEEEAVNGGNDGEVHQSGGAGNDVEAVKHQATSSNGAETA